MVPFTAVRQVFAGFLLAVMTLAGSGQAVADTDNGFLPSATLSLDKVKYQPGDTVTATVTVDGPIDGSETLVSISADLQVPASLTPSNYVLDMANTECGNASLSTSYVQSHGVVSLYGNLSKSDIDKAAAGHSLSCRWTVRFQVASAGTDTESVSKIENSRSLFGQGSVLNARDSGPSQTITVAMKSSNAGLTSLTASSGNLSPPRPLSIDLSSGDIYVDNDVTSVRFKPVAADSNASVTVGGKAVASGAESEAIPVAVGRTDIEIVVTAEDGTTKKILPLTVFRAGSADATLSDLYAAEAELAPEFSSDTTSYAGTVPFSVSTLSLYAQSNDPAATVTVGTTTLTSGGTFKLSLAAGKNEVDVVVKAANGAATKTYKLAITRPAAKTQVAVQVTPPFPTQGKLGDIFKYGLSIVNAGSGTPAIGKLASYSAVRDSKSADICSVVDGGNEDDPFMFSFNAPGDCLIHVTSTESADYLPYQHDYHITVLANFKPSPLISFLSTPPAQAKIGQSYLVQVLSGAPKARPLHTGRAQASPPPDPVLSIAKASAAVCSLSDTTVTFTGAGSCEIDADTPETKTFAAAHASQIVMVENGHRDPTEDPVIPDVVHDQIATTQNFTAVQMNNVENRLFELHGDDVPVFDQQASLTVDGEALPINALAFAAVSPENKAEPGLAIDRIAPLDAAKPADAGLAFPYRFWTAGSISFGSDTPEDRTGSTFRGADLTAGMDMTVATGLKLGVSIGRNGNRTEFDDAGSYTIARGYAGTIYGSWQAEPGLFVDGLVGYGTGTMDIHRYDVDADAMAISSRGYRSLFAAIGLMDEIKRGDWTFSPSVKLDASRTGLDAYTETGADAYDLDFASLSTTSLRASAEAKVSYAFRTEHGMLRPSASIGYRHEFSGGYDQRLGYVSDPGTVYDIAGEAAAESEFLLGLGISYQPDGRTAIDLAYSGAYSQTTRSNTIRAQVSRRF